MKSPDPPAPTEGQENADSDLERRLSNYRRRIDTEARPRSIKVIDRAIDDAARKARSAP